MALDFNASGRFVNHGSAASLDDLPATAITLIAWVYRTANGGNQHVITKDGSFPGGFVLVVDNGFNEGEFRFIAFRTDTGGSNWAESISGAGNVVPLNSWTMIAAVYTFNQAPKLYLGGLGTAAAEVSSYALQQVGAGAYLSDAGSNLYAGNLQRATTLPFKGRIARTGVFNRALSAAEIESLRLAWAPIPGCVLMTDYIGTGTQVDASGSGNAGTVTGAAAADHVPLAGLCRETASALSLTGKQVANAGIATEADSGLPLTARLLASAGLCIETSAALAPGGSARANAGIAAESAAALALTGKQLAGVGAANEVDSALPLSSGGQSAGIGIAAETDAALPLTGAQRRTLTPANENDQAWVVSGQIRRDAGIALETDAALALAGGGGRPSVDTPRARTGRPSRGPRVGTVSRGRRAG